jgi:hypothetical protein
VREQLGKLGGSLMILGAGAALAYLIASRATGQPSPHLTWPVWPYWLCLGMFAVGGFLYGEARGWLPWQKYRALKQRAETAESDIGNMRTELERAQREHDEVRSELETAQLAVVSSGLEVAIDREVQTPRPGIGRILEIEYHVTNHDPMEHQLFKHLEGNGDGGRLYLGPPDSQADPEHQRFIQEAHRIEERRSGEVPRRVPARGTVHGVYVTTFAWNPRRSLPDYTLVVGDGRRDFPVRPHGVAESMPATSEPPPFGLRYYAREGPLAGGRATSHFVGVQNPAGQPERRARITAEGMDPYPQNRSQFASVEPRFSHPVPPESGGAAGAGRVIGPGQEQSWYLGQTWIRGDGKVSVSRFFSVTDADWLLDPDERWRISYRIECDGVPDKQFSVVIAVEDSELVVRLEGS